MTCIVIVESDVLVRSPLAQYLRDCGYRVWEASTAADAHILISEQAHIVSIVLADVDLPDDNGFALANWVRNNHPHIDVILAGSISTAAKKAGDLCQDGPAVQKPYDHQIVLAHIRRLRAARERNS